MYLSVYLSICLSLVSPDFLSKKLHPIHTPFHSSRLLSDTGVHFLYMKKGLQGFISILFLNCRVYFSSQETRVYFTEYRNYINSRIQSLIFIPRLQGLIFQDTELTFHSKITGFNFYSRIQSLLCIAGYRV